jgi:hypothetical protein
MSDIAELMARLSSMNESESGGSSGGGGIRIHPGAEGSGGVISELAFLLEEVEFGMASKFQGLMDILSPSMSFEDMVRVATPALGNVTFDSLEKFMPIAIRSKLVVLSQKNFILSNLKPPNMAIGGIKTVFGKKEGGEQGH